jgi:hypothetical protein
LAAAWLHDTQQATWWDACDGGLLNIVQTCEQEAGLSTQCRGLLLAAGTYTQITSNLQCTQVPGGHPKHCTTCNPPQHSPAGCLWVPSGASFRRNAAPSCGRVQLIQQGTPEYAGSLSYPAKQGSTQRRREACRHLPPSPHTRTFICCRGPCTAALHSAVCQRQAPCVVVPCTSPATTAAATQPQHAIRTLGVCKTRLAHTHGDS